LRLSCYLPTLVTDESDGRYETEWHRDGYFDLEALDGFDPDFAFPGYTFNAGHFVAMTGVIKRSAGATHSRSGPAS
jgi:hypothetical protein